MSRESFWKAAVQLPWHSDGASGLAGSAVGQRMKRTQHPPRALTVQSVHTSTCTHRTTARRVNATAPPAALTVCACPAAAQERGGEKEREA